VDTQDLVLDSDSDTLVSELDGVESTPALNWWSSDLVSTSSLLFRVKSSIWCHKESCPELRLQYNFRKRDMHVPIRGYGESL